RERFALETVGITGSCGKTTVKGMMESICQQQGKTLATKGNFNNHIGLPLTLLRLDETYQYAVIEMGASGAGEIQYLGKIAKPNVTLITNV
ncbi:MAG TPA: Mur ligase family protein, partial [Candidatus Berkiella sp.]|nr:Mur ligase family protein [Candidatus Berkiella sp.]